MNAGESRNTNPVVWFGFAVLLAIGLMLLLTSFVPSNTGWWMMTWGMGWGLVAMLVPVVLIILVLVAALGALTPPPEYVPPPPSTLETLDIRYARGEIPRDEYLRVRADLEHGAR